MPPDSDQPKNAAIDTKPSPRQFKWRYVVILFVIVLTTYGVFAGLQLQGARDNLTAGSDRLNSLDEELHDLLALISTPDTQDGGEASTTLTLAAVLDELKRAVTDFEQATERLDAPLLQPIGIVPVIGRQLGVVSDLADASLVTTDALATALAAVESATTQEVQTPQERVAIANEITAALRTLLATMSEVTLPSSDGLMTPVADAWNKFSRHFNRAHTGVSDAYAIAHGVTTFLSGPHDYLILASNNAEMQAGSGMFLQVGELHVDHGVLSTGEFTPSEDLYLSTGAGDLDPDIDRNWGWLHPNQEWRNLNVSPRFDQSAQMAINMWGLAQQEGLVTTTATEPVGVFALDIAGVQDLIELTGPVDVVDANGNVETVTADTVIADLTLGQYLRDTGRAERRERLGEISSAVFQALTERPIPAVDLIATIRASGRERRLLIWSQDNTQQAAWEALNVGGVLESNAVMLSLLNRGGNKLDPFLEVQATVRQQRVTSGEHTGATELIVTVDIANNTPEGLPRYVEGPLNPDLADAGEYRGIVMLTLPGGAHTLAASGEPFAVRGADGPNNVVGVNVSIQRGSSLSVTFSSLIPDEIAAIRFTPSARLPRTVWDLGPRMWNEYGPLTFAVADVANP